MSHYKTTFLITAKLNEQENTVNFQVTDKNDEKAPDVIRSIVNDLMFMLTIAARESFAAPSEKHPKFQNGYECEISLEFTEGDQSDEIEIDVSAEGVISVFFARCVDLYLKEDADFFNAMGLPKWSLKK